MNLQQAHEIQRRELMSLRAENARLQKGLIPEYEEQIRLLKAEIRALTGKNKDLSEVEAFLRKELDKKQALCKQQQEELRSFLSENKALSDEVYELRLKVKMLSDGVAELTCANKKLTVQKERSFENSSVPSSAKPLHKKICNNREPSGLKPGAQPGHSGYSRKKQTATKTVFVPAPDEIVADPDYYPTGKTIHKQVVDVIVSVNAVDYYAFEYRRKSNGARYHAPFPVGVRNDVTYGSSVKALAFLLNNFCNVSIAKTSEFIKEITNGSVNMSAGMINSLTKEFSARTESDRAKIFHALLHSNVIYSDATVGRVNGSGKAVIVCTNDSGTLLFAKDRKGHAGLKDTPVERFRGTIVHDHDKTYYRYGYQHQECLSHVLRYLKSSMEYEPHLSWNTQMHTHLQSMIHRAKDAREKGELIPPEEVLQLRKEYFNILKTAKAEYKKHPPDKGYVEGLNLSKRMREFGYAHTHFLDHPEVDFTNNVSERCARKYKRKQQQMVTFRSPESMVFFCDALSVIETNKLYGISPYHTAASIFNR